MKLVKSVSLLFASFLLLFSIQNSGGSGLMLPNNLGIWFLVSLLILASFAKVIIEQKLYVSRYVLGLLFGLWVIFLFSLVETDASVEWVWMTFLAFMGLSLFALSVYQWRLKHNDFINILILLSAVGLFHAITSIIQVFDELRVWHSLTGYTPWGIDLNRPAGIVQQINMNASLMAFFTISNLYLMTFRRFLKGSLFIKLVVLLSAILCLYVVLLSSSRAALLGLVLGVTFLFASRYKTMIKEKTPFIIWISTAIISSVLFFNSLSMEEPGLLISKVQDVYLGLDVRLLFYLYTIDLIMVEPLFGYGLQGFQEAFRAYIVANGIPSEFMQHKNSFYSLTHPHNELLFWMAQSGLIVLVVILALLFIYIKLLIKQTLKFSLPVIGLMIPLVVQAMVSLPYSISILHLLLLLFLILYSVKSSRLSYQLSLSPSAKQLSLGVVSMFVMVMVVAFMLSAKSILEVFDYTVGKHKLPAYQDKLFLETATYHPSFSYEINRAMNVNVQKHLAKNRNLRVQEFIRWAEMQGESSLDEVTLHNLRNARLFIQNSQSE